MDVENALSKIKNEIMAETLKLKYYFRYSGFYPSHAYTYERTWGIVFYLPQIPYAIEKDFGLKILKGIFEILGKVHSIVEGKGRVKLSLMVIPWSRGYDSRRPYMNVNSVRELRKCIRSLERKSLSLKSLKEQVDVRLSPVLHLVLSIICSDRMLREVTDYSSEHYNPKLKHFIVILSEFNFKRREMLEVKAALTQLLLQDDVKAVICISHNRKAMLIEPIILSNKTALSKLRFYIIGVEEANKTSI